MNPIAFLNIELTPMPVWNPITEDFENEVDFTNDDDAYTDNCSECTHPWQEDDVIADGEVDEEYYQRNFWTSHEDWEEEKYFMKINSPEIIHKYSAPWDINDDNPIRDFE